MSKPNDGGPAFPVNDLSSSLQADGMTLRDYFAASALQGILAEGGMFSERFEHNGAEEAYRMADAMLAERSK